MPTKQDFPDPMFTASASRRPPAAQQEAVLRGENLADISEDFQDPELATSASQRSSAVQQETVLEGENLSELYEDEKYDL